MGANKKRGMEAGGKPPEEMAAPEQIVGDFFGLSKGEAALLKRLIGDEGILICAADPQKNVDEPGDWGLANRIANYMSTIVNKPQELGALYAKIIEKKTAK